MTTHFTILDEITYTIKTEGVFGTCMFNNRSYTTRHWNTYMYFAYIRSSIIDASTLIHPWENELIPLTLYFKFVDKSDSGSVREEVSYKLFSSVYASPFHFLSLSLSTIFATHITQHTEQTCLLWSETNLIHLHESDCKMINYGYCTNWTHSRGSDECLNTFERSQI